MKKVITYIAVILLSGFIIIQFFRPEKANNDSGRYADISVYKGIPPDINQILKKSCYDCHSNNTKYPWYSNIMPFGWIISYDIKKGRNALNFSEWSKYTESEQMTLLGKVCGMTASGKMPHWKYLLIHKNAVLNQDERNSLCKWSLNAGIKKQ